MRLCSGWVDSTPLPNRITTYTPFSPPQMQQPVISQNMLFQTAWLLADLQLTNSRVEPFAARSKTIPRPLVNWYFKETMQNLNFSYLVMCLDANKWEREAKYHQNGQAYTSLNPVWKRPETNSKLMLGNNISNDASHTKSWYFVYWMWKLTLPHLMASLDLHWRSSYLKTSVWFKWQTPLNRAMVLRKSICQGESRLWQQKDFPHSGAKTHLRQVAFDKLTLWSLYMIFYTSLLQSFTVSWYFRRACEDTHAGWIPTTFGDFCLSAWESCRLKTAEAGVQTIEVYCKNQKP